MKLNDSFSSDHKIIDLINALRSKDFHQLRTKSEGLQSLEIDESKPNQIKISRQINFDIPASAKSLVSNPINLEELWTFQHENKVIIEISIPNIQTHIKAEIVFSLQNSKSIASIATSVESKIFLVSSFAEEFVSKYWKKALGEDFILLNTWINS
jgi:hypothetical protein